MSGHSKSANASTAGGENREVTEKNAHQAHRAAHAEREEALLDDAVEASFPASDPVAEVPAAATSTKVIDSEDAELDKAIEMTFPASDPVAVSNITKVVPKKAD